MLWLNGIIILVIIEASEVPLGFGRPLKEPFVINRAISGLHSAVLWLLKPSLPIPPGYGPRKNLQGLHAILCFCARLRDCSKLISARKVMATIQTLYFCPEGPRPRPGVLGPNHKNKSPKYPNMKYTWFLN